MSILFRLLVVCAILSVVSGDCISLYSVHGAEGCARMDGDYPAGCEAGMQLTLHGLQLQAVTQAFIANTYPCNITGKDNDMLNCTLPALPPALTATGTKQNVTVSNDNVDCSKTWNGITYKFDPPVPVIAAVYGCDPNNTMSTTTCDGSANSAAMLTIVGEHFGDQSFVKLVGSSGNTYTPINPTPTFNNDTYITVSTFTLQPADIGQPAQLFVTNAATFAVSAGYSLTFASSGADDDAAVKILGLSMLTFIIIVTVIALVVLIVFALCVLSVCCGVSLACLNMCCPCRSSSGAVRSDSGYSSGYTSMS